jgi:hypothetical protein
MESFAFVRCAPFSACDHLMNLTLREFQPCAFVELHLRGNLQKYLPPEYRSLEQGQAMVEKHRCNAPLKRQRIEEYPKIVYQGLIEELISKNPQGGVNGYILEKLWLYIFDK